MPAVVNISIPFSCKFMKYLFIVCHMTFWYQVLLDALRILLINPYLSTRWLLVGSERLITCSRSNCKVTGLELESKCFTASHCFPKLQNFFPQFLLMSCNIFTQFCILFSTREFLFLIVHFHQATYLIFQTLKFFNAFFNEAKFT